MKGIFVLGAFDLIYDAKTVHDLAAMVDLDPAPYTAESIRSHPEALRDCDIIFSGWGAPKMDEEFLSRAPKLKIVFIMARAACTAWSAMLSGSEAYDASAPGGPTPSRYRSTLWA